MARRTRGCGCGCFGCLGRLLALVLLVAMAAGYGLWEASDWRVDEHAVISTDVPQSMDGLRIVFVADIHEGPFWGQSNTQALVQRINALQPDIVLLGGDYSESSAGAVTFFERLPPITSTYGTLAVMGNNDRTPPESNLLRIRQAMQAQGIYPLVNEILELHVGDGSILVGGVDDLSGGIPDVSALRRHVDPWDFCIFMSHSPDILPSVLGVDEPWIDLALCAHTHGGQVTLFGFYPFMNNSRYGMRYLSGWKQENGAQILTTNGIGTTVVPLRFFAPPQIHVITLRRP